MSIVSLVGLTAAIIVLAASPGPGVISTVALALSSGVRSALLLIAGMVVGDSIYLLFAIFGMTIVANVTGQMFMLVKIAGGVYLIIHGLRIWLSAPADGVDIRERKAGSDSGYMLNGLLISLANPKVILFYCGFLPTFIDLGDMVPMDIAIVVGIITVVSFIVLGAYAMLASSSRRLFTNRTARRRLDQAAGGVMVAVGVAIAVRR